MLSEYLGVCGNIFFIATIEGASPSAKKPAQGPVSGGMPANGNRVAENTMGIAMPLLGLRFLTPTTHAVAGLCAGTQPL